MLQMEEYLTSDAVGTPMSTFLEDSDICQMRLVCKKMYQHGLVFRNLLLDKLELHNWMKNCSCITVRDIALDSDQLVELLGEFKTVHSLCLDKMDRLQDDVFEKIGPVVGGSLVGLYISDCYCLTNDALRVIGENLVNLESLEISGILDIGRDDIMGLENLPLRLFGLHGSGIVEMEMPWQLEALYLTNCINLANWDFIKDNAQNLRRLSLSGSGVNTPLFHVSNEYEKLEYLELNYFGDLTNVTFDRVGIKELSLHGMMMEVDGVSRKLHELETLRWWNIHVDSYTVEHLIRGCPKLKGLEIDARKIDQMNKLLNSYGKDNFKIENIDMDVEEENIEIELPRGVDEMLIRDKNKKWWENKLVQDTAKMTLPVTVCAFITCGMIKLFRLV